MGSAMVEMRRDVTISLEGPDIDMFGDILQAAVFGLCDRDNSAPYIDILSMIGTLADGIDKQLKPSSEAP